MPQRVESGDNAMIHCISFGQLMVACRGYRTDEMRFRVVEFATNVGGNFGNKLYLDGK